MALEERDTHSGYMTTGHEWNGIKELNTPVPRAVLFFLIATAAFALIYWVLMPAWPLGTTYTKGLLGNDQRRIVEDSVKQALRDRSDWTAKIESKSFAEIQNDPDLMDAVRRTGHTLFGDNCAPCHGRNARGNVGFPNLTAHSFLWGGSPEAIDETIRVGINSTNPQTRNSQMLAFGRDGMLPPEKIEDVVAFVASLSGIAVAGATPERTGAGKAIFLETCASCHGENAKGKSDVGAPDLTDHIWIYGGDQSSIYRTVWGGRQGHMPSWEGRLSPTDRKILALYVVDLRSGEP